MEGLQYPSQYCFLFSLPHYIYGGRNPRSVRAENYGYMSNQRDQRPNSNFSFKSERQYKFQKPRLLGPKSEQTKTRIMIKI